MTQPQEPSAVLGFVGRGIFWDVLAGKLLAIAMRSIEQLIDGTVKGAYIIDEPK